MLSVLIQPWRLAFNLLCEDVWVSDLSGKWNSSNVDYETYYCAVRSTSFLFIGHSILHNVERSGTALYLFILCISVFIAEIGFLNGTVLCAFCVS